MFAVSDAVSLVIAAVLVVAFYGLRVPRRLRALKRGMGFRAGPRRNSGLAVANLHGLSTSSDDDRAHGGRDHERGDDDGDRDDDPNDPDTDGSDSDDFDSGDFDSGDFDSGD